MSRLKPSWLALSLVAAFSPRPGNAAPPDTRIRFDQVTSKWTVEENGTWTVDADVTMQVPNDNPTHVVRLPLTWSASTEKLDVVLARLDKPDGHSVVLGKEAMREDPPTGDRYFHEFSDMHRVIITFADAQVGDTILVRAHREVFHPRVPGGFMAAPILDPAIGWEETNFTISVPSDRRLFVETHGFDDQTELIRDRVMHYLHSPRIPRQAKQATVLGAFDRVPRFAVSTFRDWDEFARAYNAVLLPHAMVTPAIAAQAGKLTEGKTDKQDQARALYEWVRDNVHYVPIPLEESPPDPHDAEQVMTKLYGDVKDHVVLFYALLAARGIPAEFVLLNGSNTATIPDPPNLRPMNHLILYLPSLSLYADTTQEVAPFGVLPFPELGKPAIHLGGLGLARRDIPIPASGDTTSDMKTDLTMDANGTVTGTTTTTATGAFGIWLREDARRFQSDAPGSVITLLRGHGTPGTGTFAFDPPTAAGDTYKVSGTFQLQNQASLLHGGYFAPWTGLRILPRPGDLLGGLMFVRGLANDEPTFCYAGQQTEEISLTTPEGRELGSVPPDTKIDTAVVRYRSHWKLDGRRVTVTRDFQSLVTGPVCRGPVREDMAKVLATIRADLGNPLGIRQDKLPSPTTSKIVPDEEVSPGDTVTPLDATASDHPAGR